MKKYLVFSALLGTLTLVAIPASYGDQPFSSLEERMTGAEFRASGLHKLSDEELAQLNRWLRQHSVAPLETPRAGVATADGAADGVDRRGLRSADSGSKEPIVSRIRGSFNGWEGNMEFELENGMVWETVNARTLHTGALESPEVTITPRLLGSGWEMRVEGYNQRAQVRRIR